MPARALEPFILLGLLANYNKFEFRNPYRLRLEDFVNENVVQKIINGFSETCASLRKGYTDVIDDLPTDPSWTLANTLSYIGLGMLAPIKAINPIAAPEDYKEKFGVLYVTIALKHGYALTAIDQAPKLQYFLLFMTSLMPINSSTTTSFQPLPSLRPHSAHTSLWSLTFSTTLTAPRAQLFMASSA